MGVKPSHSDSGCRAGQHAGCERVALSTHEHRAHLVSRQTHGHSQLWAFEKFGWVCFTSSSSPPPSYHPFRNPYWKIAPEKYNLQVTELNTGLEETITLLCDNWLHSAFGLYPYILEMTPYSHCGTQVQIGKGRNLLGLTLTLMALLPTIKLEQDTFALTLNPLFTVKAV